MIDKEKYTASAMNRLTINHSNIMFEEDMQTALDKIMNTAEDGNFECWIYERDIHNCYLSDLAVELKKLGYTVCIEREYNNCELHVSWE